MIGGVVEIAEDGRHLSLFRGFLKVSEGATELGRVPLDDITALVLSAHQISLSKNIMSALLERKVIIVTTGKNWHPLGLTLPLEAHYGHAGILRDQIALSEARRKRLWQQLVRSKIDNQKYILECAGADSDKVQELGILIKRVRSGDPDNIEAQAARQYWPALMGKDFRRDRTLDGANAFLNYGYTILRAATARAVVAAGLHPALGLHHKSQVNAFALVDDLMEPFRPVVDGKVAKMLPYAEGLTPEHKRALVSLLQLDLLTEKGASPLVNCLHQLARSVVSCLTDKAQSLQLPQFRQSGRLFMG
jgi:CRISPR-associated protein Cas1